MATRRTTAATVATDADGFQEKIQINMIKGSQMQGKESFSQTQRRTQGRRDFGTDVESL